jgi:hypothetical protein
MRNDDGGWLRCQLSATIIQDQMNMVGHQAQRPHLDIGRPAMLTQEVAVQHVVAVAEKIDK